MQLHVRQSTQPLRFCSPGLLSSADGERSWRRPCAPPHVFFSLSLRFGACRRLPPCFSAVISVSTLCWRAPFCAWASTCRVAFRCVICPRLFHSLLTVRMASRSERLVCLHVASLPVTVSVLRAASWAPRYVARLCSADYVAWLRNGSGGGPGSRCEPVSDPVSLG